MTKKAYYFSLISTILLYSCGTKPIATSKEQDDLSIYRIVFQPIEMNAEAEEKNVFPVMLENSPLGITNELNQFIDTLAILNKKMKYVQGYRVQVYSGRSREEANKVKEKVYSINQEAKIFTEYKQPYFKVKVGNYVDRLEAQPMYADLVKHFEGVIVVPDQVEIGNL